MSETPLSPQNQTLNQIRELVIGSYEQSEVRPLEKPSVVETAGRIDIDEPVSVGPMWDQAEREAKFLAEQQRATEHSHEQELNDAANAMTDKQVWGYLAQVGAVHVGVREGYVRAA